MKPPLRRRYTFRLPDAAAEWAGAALSDVFSDGLLLRPRPGGVTVLQGWCAPKRDLDARLRTLGAQGIRWRLESPAPPKALHGRFPVLRLGRFVIVPKAKAAGLKPRKAERRIVLVQGQAFGTGLHESTRLMLGALERLKPQGMKVLDVGAGSGVLGFAALLLGACSVTSVELEGPACAEMRENRALNAIRAAQLPVIHAAFPISRLKARRFPLVLGNLVTPVLQALMPRLAAQVAKGGVLLCSGIHTDAEVRTVTAAAVAAGLKPGPKRSLRRWHVLQFNRP